MTLHLFNPGHDEALAAGTPYYTDSRAAQILARDLYSLPRLWAKGEDIWSLPLETKNWDAITAVEPWGWDIALVHRMLRCGAPERLLPSRETLATIRKLSSRRTAVDLLPQLSDFHTTWCETMEEVEKVLDGTTSMYIKAPWSSSGRGILRTCDLLSVSERGRIARWIHQQGAVVVEPAYEKQQDFALEFEATEEGIEYVGLSLFATEGTGAYAGNYVATEEYLRTFLPPLDNTIISVRNALERYLKGRYIGPLGVDMMVLSNGDIHPCVEVNLRRTMGWVALQLRSFVEQETCFQFIIRPVSPISENEINLTPEGQQLQAILQKLPQEHLSETINSL